MIRRIAALATSFNRRELTLASLEALLAQDGVESIELSVFLVDDGSSDGTTDAVAAKFPMVRVLRGSGSLFWNGGMRVAFENAMREKFDAYLWFNDDSNLYFNALARLLACAEEQAATGDLAIVVGSMRSPATGKRTYGGWKKRASRLHLHFDPVIPDPVQATTCDTMNGNLVLIPEQVTRVVGNLEPTFTHQIGDLDYGLRARRAGISVLVAPGYHGECSDNSSDRTWRDKRIPRAKRWQHLMSPKGAPWREWSLYTRRHFGWRWPIYAASPYLKTWLGL